MNASRFPARLLMVSIAFALAACTPQGGNEKVAKDTAGAATENASSSNASTPNRSNEPPSIERSVAELFNGAKPQSVSESVIPGLFEVSVRGGVFYTTKDGKYFLNGELLEVDGRKNITAIARDKARGAMMDRLEEKDSIIFKAKGETKEVLHVFTDVECGYCREFHKRISAYNDLGLEVHYYPWPRSGTQGPVFDEMVSVWCAKDKHAALTRAKEGKGAESKTCENPVAKYYELGQELGVNGTPAVFLSDGKQIGGYVPPENIMQMIQDTRARAGE